VRAKRQINTALKRGAPLVVLTAGLILGFQNCGKLGNTGAPTPILSNSSASASQTGSPNGSTIPGVNQLIDSQLNIWTVVSGVVYKNGATAGFTSEVTVLLYYSGFIFQENINSAWWGWNGSAWIALTGDPRTTSFAAADL
jgi:hypothetical protein